MTLPDDAITSARQSPRLLGSTASGGLDRIGTGSHDRTELTLLYGRTDCWEHTRADLRVFHAVAVGPPLGHGAFFNVRRDRQRRLVIL